MEEQEPMMRSAWVVKEADRIHLMICQFIEDVEDGLLTRNGERQRLDDIRRSVLQFADDAWTKKAVGSRLVLDEQGNEIG